MSHTPSPTPSAVPSSSSAAADERFFQLEPASLTPALLGESAVLASGGAAALLPGHSRQGAAASGHRRVRAASLALTDEPGCVVPLEEGGLLIAQRDGLWRFDPERVDAGDASGYRRLIDPPYDPSKRRFNDGKAGEGREGPPVGRHHRRRAVNRSRRFTACAAAASSR
ncbi:hypothetical protein Ddc_20500 [Ditylenchus destructor]|nr:hypothetical protein Ddc_20500 [Ditylenchus destructor]